MACSVSSAPQQEHRKQPLIVAGRAAKSITSAHRRHQHRTVCGDHTPTTPARNQTGLVGAAHQEIAPAEQGGQVQLLARLVERAIAHAAMRHRAVAQRGEEGVERDLLRLPAQAKQRGDQARQGQLAVAREGLGVLGVPGPQGELGRMDGFREFEQD